MKKQTIIIAVLIFYILILGVQSKVYKKTDYDYNSSKNEKFNQKLEKLKPASSWTLKFIHIKANWSLTNITYDWCSGSGTHDDPFVIENVTVINPSGIAYIKIENSHDYFLLKKCTVQQQFTYIIDSKGIELINVKNGTIQDCNSYLNFYGIRLENCANISIINYNPYSALIGNIFSGVYLLNSNNNTLKNILINPIKPFGESLYGLCLNQSNYNNISYNFIANNEFGLYLYRSNNSYISNNVLRNNSLGIEQIQCKNNVFYNNDDDSPNPTTPGTNNGDDDDDDEDNKNKIFDIGPFLEDTIKFIIDPLTLAFIYPILSVLVIIIFIDFRRFVLKSR